MIKVSVIVPVYNVENFIEKCLDSLVNQTLKDIEIIVVNDGSPDNSQRIIDKYTKKYPNLVKSYIKENGGQGSARNLGLDVAKGEYISFVDSDDYIDKDMLLEMYNLAKKDKSDMVVCNMVDLYDNGEKVYHDYVHYNNVYRMAGSSCNKIFRRTFIKNIKFLSKIWYEDLEFTARIILMNPKISCIDKPFYICNSGHISTMNNNNSLKNIDMILVLDSIKEFMIKNNLYSDDIFSYLCYRHVLVSTLPRVYVQKNKDRKKVLKKLHNYYKKNVSKKYWKSIYFVGENRNDKIVAFLFYIHCDFIFGLIHYLRLLARMM